MTAKKQTAEIPEPKDNEFRVRVDLDAHDDIYYEVLQGTHYVAQRMYDLDDVMILLRGKIEKVFK